MIMVLRSRIIGIGRHEDSIYSTHQNTFYIHAEQEPRLLFVGIQRWLDETIFSLGREMRVSYLPPLMVYIAAGVSGLTGIVGTFFVKDYLGLSAAFLAALGFWAGGRMRP